MSGRRIRSGGFRARVLPIVALGPLLATCRREAEPPDVLALAAARARRQEPSEAPSQLAIVAFEFRDPSLDCPAATTTSCALDAIDGVRTTGIAKINHTAPVRLEGWAADGAAKQVPNIVIVELLGPARLLAPATRSGDRRNDVAEALKADALAMSGYVALTSFRDVKPGEYRVAIRQIDAAGNAMSCDTHQRIVVP